MFKIVYIRKYPISRKGMCDRMGRIMVVDDERELLSLYRDMIEIFEHELVSATANGEEALEAYMAMEEKPDLIILDHRMPLRNGLETASEILSMDPDMKIIFVSADPSVRKAAMEMGVIEFLEKPFVLRTLKETIDKSLKE